MRCTRCGKELDIEKDEIFGVYIYPQDFSVKNKKHTLQKTVNLKVSDGDFSRLSREHFCDDCARSINAFSKSLNLDKFDKPKIKTLAGNDWTIQDIALDLDAPRGIVMEILRKEAENEVSKKDKNEEKTIQENSRDIKKSGIY